MEEKEVFIEAEKRLLKTSDIGLQIDRYEDIFSSFDPRPYSQRALSDDFLSEAKRASRDKETGNIELKFLLPPHMRSFKQEIVIKKRLREHFKKHFERLKRESKGIMTEGLTFTFVGVLIMFIAAYFLFQKQDQFYITFMIILLEPAGWFFFWEGLNQIVFISRTKKPELEFYEKMASCRISFSSY